MAGGSAAWTWAISSRPVPVSSSGSSVIARTIADPPRALGGLRDRCLPAAGARAVASSTPPTTSPTPRAASARLAEDEHGQADGGHGLDEEHDRGQGGRQAGEATLMSRYPTTCALSARMTSQPRDGQDGKR